MKLVRLADSRLPIRKGFLFRLWAEILTHLASSAIHASPDANGIATSLRA